MVTMVMEEATVSGYTRGVDECCEGNCKVSIGCYHDHCTGPGTFGPTPIDWSKEDEDKRIQTLKDLGRYIESGGE